MENVGVKQGFTNKKGMAFPNILSRNFSHGNICGNIGVLVSESRKNKSGIFFNSSVNNNDGAYIFVDKNDPNVQYKIYKEYAEPGFEGYNDDHFISKLQERQNQVSSLFPYGVVTLDGRIIGQIAPYHNDVLSLHDYFEENNVANPNRVYLQLLRKMKELMDAGIYYVDIHPNNYLVTKDEDIEIIDFDEWYVRFDSPQATQDIISKLVNLFNYLNDKIGIEKRFSETETIEELMNEVSSMKLSKKVVNE